MKRYLNIIIWVAALLVLGALFFFINQRYKQLVCETVNINIDTSNDVFFLSQADIWKMIKQTGDPLIGSKVAQIKTEFIESTIEENVYVKDAKVYTTFGGEVNIEIVQRRPIARCMTLKKQHFLLDEDGFIMPISKRFIPRVIIVHGYFRIDTIKQALLTEKDTTRQQAFIKKTNIPAVYMMAKTIDTSAYWKAQLSEIIVNFNRDMWLVPQYWPHVVVFGDVNNMVEKFDKLFLFYRKELVNFGINKYTRINLKYKNQLVCTKKTL